MLNTDCWMRWSTQEKTRSMVKYNCRSICNRKTVGYLSSPTFPGVAAAGCVLCHGADWYSGLSVCCGSAPGHLHRDQSGQQEGTHSGRPQHIQTHQTPEFSLAYTTHDVWWFAYRLLLCWLDQSKFTKFSNVVFLKLLTPLTLFSVTWLFTVAHVHTWSTCIVR